MHNENNCILYAGAKIISAHKQNSLEKAGQANLVATIVDGEEAYKA